MKKEDLKDWSRDRLETEIVNLSDKNFSLEQRGNQYEESNGRMKCKMESIRNKNKELEEENSCLKCDIKSQREKIDSLLKELEEEKGKTITISDGAVCMRADMWEIINKNKSLQKEVKYLKDMVLKIEAENVLLKRNLELQKEWTKIVEERNGKIEFKFSEHSEYPERPECDCCGCCDDPDDDFDIEALVIEQQIEIEKLNATIDVLLERIV